MRKPFVLIIISFISFITELKAQELSKEYIDLCNDFLSNLRRDSLGFLGEITIRNSIDTTWWNYMLTKVDEDGVLSKANKFYEREQINDPNSEKVFYRKVDSFLLSLDEMKIIREDLRKTKNFKWGNNILDSCKFITDRHLDSLLNQEENGPYSFYRSFPNHRLYSISLPIFLQNNSVCVFYFGYSCGNLCGYGVLNIYRRGKNGWKRIENLFNWVS